MCHFCSVLVSEIANMYGRRCKLSRSNFYIKKLHNHTRDVIVLVVILTGRTFLLLSHHQLFETNRTTVHVLVLVVCSTQGRSRPQYDGRSVGPSWLSVPPPPTPTGARNRYRAELTFRRRIKSRLPFAGIIRRLSYSTRFQDKG